jgi:2-polyprenyl-3-methyl-5-hydroxy-6-metoxy-1,4-benzoquinol methylase
MLASLADLVRPFWRRIRPYPDHWSRFERDFKFAKWDQLCALAELGRYSILVGYCQFLAAKSILDVGCGQGILAEKLKTLPYEKYLGIDFASSAILEARERRGDERTEFLVADAKNFTAESKFDVIVFGDSLYYFDDFSSILQRYSEALSENGVMVVSCYDTFRTRIMWPSIEKDMIVQDETVVMNKAGKRWTVKQLIPLRKRRKW